MEKYFKTLSRNDTGETHSHQSGISIPKLVARTPVFPQLGKEELNPRTEVCFFDEENTCWKFQYIYYNDVFHHLLRFCFSHHLYWLSTVGNIYC